MKIYIITSKTLKMKRLFFLLLPIFFIFQSCFKQKEYTTLMGETQGTTYSIVYLHPDAKMLKEQIDSILLAFESSLSTWEENSIISRVNKNDSTVILDEHFKIVFAKSMEISEVSDGMFDVTIAPIINAFGFGATTKSQIDSALVDSLLQYVGYKKIKIENDKIVKENHGVTLDFSAIAQGYSVDVVCKFLEEQGCENYLVEIGGEVKTLGKNSTGDNWTIGVDKPIEGSDVLDRQIQAIIKLSGKALATSGNYRKFYEENGIKFSHTFNPKTGYPIRSKLLSATIMASDCISADGYATACMVLGLEKSIELVEKDADLEAYFIYSNDDGTYGEYFSKGLEDLIVEVK